jgi:23S rRNA (guanosine2251-2'-O)-methyltransferase
MSELIIGRRAVLETLRAGRRNILRLSVEGHEGEKTTGTLHEIITAAKRAGVPTRHFRDGLFDKLAREQANAQGVALEVGDYPYASLDACFDLARQRKEEILLLLLDHLQDPQNLGTLIRTAEAMGVHGILMPDRRAVRITSAVSNASAGAVEHMLVVQVTNLNRTMEELKEEGVWIAGLDDSTDAVELAAANLRGPMALVVGSEGEGISRLTRERCDFLVRIPMFGEIGSLNASIAGSIALYAVRQARGK